MALLYIALIVGAMLLMQYFQRNASLQRPSYSEFKQWVREGRVAEVFISENMIQGRLKQEKGAEGKPPGFITVRVADEDLVRDLEAHQVQFTGVPRSFLGDILIWGLMILAMVVLLSFFLRRMGPGEAAMMFGKSRAKMYMERDTKTTFSDVAGVDEAKEELQEVIQFLKTPERFRALGGRIPKGVLIVGPPGTGKTMLAKAVAGESKVPFFSLSGSDFVEMFVGVGASRVRDLFDQATKQSPCIVFIDELDALGKARGIGGLAGSHDEREQTLNQLLVEMDGFDTNANVIIMAATNRPEILDPALLRPGRFDRQVLVDRPDINGREAILRVHAKRVKLGEDVDLHTVAARTPGFVGADLANVVNEAALLAARQDQQFVEMKDFEAAIDRIVAGLEKKTRVMNELEKKIVAYHESGHALVAASLPTTDPVHKVSIIPRGIAALGYTLQLPTEDRYLMTRQELQERLTVLLGGRVAEEIVWDDISTGAQNDLQRATDMARSMVTEYGMSDRLGPLAFGPDRQAPWTLARFPDGSRSELSEKTTQQIDEEIRRLITEAHESATQILIERRDVLERMATLLLEKEVLEGEEVQRLLQENEAPPGEGKS